MSGQTWIEAGNIWYERVPKLRVIMDDETQPQERRDKAHRLWAVLCARIIAAHQQLNKARRTFEAPNFPRGGH